MLNRHLRNAITSSNVMANYSHRKDIIPIHITSPPGNSYQRRMLSRERMRQAERGKLQQPLLRTPIPLKKKADKPTSELENGNSNSSRPTQVSNLQDLACREGGSRSNLVGLRVRHPKGTCVKRSTMIIEQST